MPRASAVRRRALLLVVAISLATLITVTATATPPDPAVYLTDDLAAKATVHAVTAL